MHSFQPSRGRILFEVLCAFGMVATCVGAWKQTGASALLAAAAIAGLYGFVHLFDLARSDPPAAAVEPEIVDAAEVPNDQPARVEFAEPEVPVRTQSVVVPFVEALPVVEKFEPVAEVELAAELEVVEVAEAVESAAPRSSRGRKPKTPRKAVSRRASAPEEPEAAEPAPQAEAAVILPMLHEEAVAEPMPSDEAEAEPMFPDEPAHPHIEPLFETDPFARMPRRAFGRKAG